MFIAIPFSLYHKEEAYSESFLAGIITIFLGGLLYFFNKPKNTNIQKKEGYLIVTLGWFHAALAYRNVTLHILRSHPLVLQMPF